MKSLTVFALISALSIPVFGMSDAQAGQHRHRGGRDGDTAKISECNCGHRFRGGGDGMIEKLNLTKEQRTKFAEVRKANFEKVQANQEKMDDLEQKFQTAVQTDTSKDQLRKMHKELQQARAEMGELRFEQLLSIRDILTPEQRTKFREGRMRNGPGPGHNCPWGRGQGRGQGQDHDE